MRHSALLCALFVTGELVPQGTPFRDAIAVRGTRLLPASVVALDADFDGQCDLVVGNAFSLDVQNGPASICLLDAAWRPRTVENLASTGEPGLVAHPIVASGDFNGDCLPDLVCISDRGTLSVHLHQGPTPDARSRPRFQRSGGLHRYALMTQPVNELAQFHVLGLAIADFNEDGYTDIVVCADARSLFDVSGCTGVVLRYGDGHGDVGDEQILHPGRFIGVQQVDLDTDGDPDLVALRIDGTVVVCRNRGHGRFEVEEFRLSQPLPVHRLVMGDANGDGRSDYLIVGGKDGNEVVLCPADARGLPGLPGTIDLDIPPQTSVEAVLLVDVDDDAVRDLVVLLVPEIGNASLRFYRGNGNLTFQPPDTVRIDARIAHSLLPAYPAFLVAEDLNGDGNRELLLGSVRDPVTERLVQLVLPNRTAARRGGRLVSLGTPGTNGVLPRISFVGGPPVLGNRDFSLLVADTLGNTRAALIMSTRLEPRECAGFRLSVFPFFSFGTRTRGDVPGSGWATLGLRIPNDPTLLTFDFHFQWVIEDRGAENPFGLSSTPAMQLRLAVR